MDDSKQPAGYGNVKSVPSAKSSDGGGERSVGMRNGVAMGLKDRIGSDKTFNSGKTEGVCYTHDRKSSQ